MIDIRASPACGLMEIGPCLKSASCLKRPITPGCARRECRTSEVTVAVGKTERSRAWRRETRERARLAQRTRLRQSAPARARSVEAVDPPRGAAEQGALFVGRGARGDALECVPQNRITRADLLDRKIALEHAAVGAKQLDA